VLHRAKLIQANRKAAEMEATLKRVLADNRISITRLMEPVLSTPSALNQEIMKAIGKLTGEFWPEVPAIPTMSPGATDGAYLRNAGIPTATPA
jgi:hypothetical protein